MHYLRESGPRENQQAFVFVKSLRFKEKKRFTDLLEAWSSPLPLLPSNDFFVLKEIAPTFQVTL